MISATNADEISAARSDLVAAFRWAVRLGLSEGIENHFSVMVPGRASQFLLNEYGLHWAEVRVSNLLTLDFNGNVLDGRGPPDMTAFYIHSRIHSRLPHAQCVLHTHMPYATALTTLENGRLEMCSQTALMVQDLIAYDDSYNGLALESTEGDRMADMLGSKRALFLGGHGVVVIGRSVAEAFDLLYWLERACQLQILALSTGRKLRVIPDAIVGKMRQQLVDSGMKSHFQALKRMLYRDEPDFTT
jgi:ribulose-5-phosphate 4-epimerase/fuculose-1-phosphate aldolase